MPIASACLLGLLLLAPADEMEPHRYQEPEPPAQAVPAPVPPATQKQVFNVAGLVDIPDDGKNHWVQTDNSGRSRATMSAGEARRAELVELIRAVTGTLPLYVGNNLVVDAPAEKLAEVEHLLAELRIPLPTLTLETRVVVLPNDLQLDAESGTAIVPEEEANTYKSLATAQQTGANGQTLTTHVGTQIAYTASYFVNQNDPAPILVPRVVTVDEGLKQSATLRLTADARYVTLDLTANLTEILDLQRQTAPAPDQLTLVKRNFEGSLSVPVGSWVLVALNGTDDERVALLVRVTTEPQGR